MPKLTGQELSDLYPKAKTFDELQAATQEIQELRRPRLVPIKVATWVTLGVVSILVAYYLIARIMSNLSDDAMQVLTSVGLSGTIAVGAVAMVIYLRSLIDELASRIIVSMPLLYTALGTIVGISGSIFGVFVQYIGYDSLFTASLVLPFVFFATYAATLLIMKHQ